MLFSSNNISEAESTIILNTFRNYSTLGIGLPKAIEILAEDKTSDHKIYTRLSYAIRERNIEPATALQNIKVINSLEAFVLKNSKSTKLAIDDILHMRKKVDLYESSIIKMFLPSILWFFGTIALIPFVTSKLFLVKNYIVELLLVSKNIDISNQIVLPFYTQEPLIITAVPFIILILFVSFYSFYYINNPFKLYKVFKGKAYADIAIFLNILLILKSTGENSHSIFQLMLKSGKFKKETKLLQNLLISKTLTSVFIKFNYPNDIIKIIKMGEQTKSFWKNLPSLIEFCHNASSNSIYKLETFWKKPIYMLAMFTGIAFAITLFLLAINAMNFMLQMAM